MLAVCVFVLIANEFYLWALVIFAIAAVTDALDGYFARLLKQDTPLGRQLDPLVDKVIVAGCYIYLATIPGTGVMPWMVTAIVVRELLIQGLRSHLEGRGQAFGARMAGKLKTVCQCLSISAWSCSVSAGCLQHRLASLASRRAHLARRHPHDLQRLELCLDRASQVSAANNDVDSELTGCQPTFSIEAQLDGMAGSTCPGLGSRNHRVSPGLERRASPADPELLRLADRSGSRRARRICFSS